MLRQSFFLSSSWLSPFSRQEIICFIRSDGWKTPATPPRPKLWKRRVVRRKRQGGARWRQLLPNLECPFVFSPSYRCWGLFFLQSLESFTFTSISFPPFDLLCTCLHVYGRFVTIQCFCTRVRACVRSNHCHCFKFSINAAINLSFLLFFRLSFKQIGYSHDIYSKRFPNSRARRGHSWFILWH